MTSVQAAKPIYHDPTRRSSSRKSLAASMSRTSSHNRPKDEDAFSFDPAHLPAWYLPQDLWDHLPAGLQSSLTVVQHSGAAVLTGKSNPS
jgi:hypothetical protein